MRGLVSASRSVIVDSGGVALAVYRMLELFDGHNRKRRHREANQLRRTGDTC
jgi:hypothetical protein